ncbi:TPA: hypothetical protein QH592_005114 [Raoultella ornithinolytica]|nr:hypothetical protein [Raoultella ornithinolytica]
MTTDTTELVQMKGQKVEGSYYLAECTDCGKMYPSNKLNGGEPLFSGDYGECYCPHCNADDAAIGDCGDTAATAWNYQQNHIDALVEALEKALTENVAGAAGMAESYETTISMLKSRIAELEEAEQKLCAANVTLDARAEQSERRLAELESRTVKLPKKNIGWDRDEEDCWNNAIDACAEVLTAAGIKWEAE